MSVCPWRDDFDYVVALHIDPLPFQSSIVFRVSIAEPQVSARRCLENDLVTPAREITSRHGVDKRSLLPLAARRDAVAKNATSRMALEADVFILQRLLSRVQSLNRQSMPSRPPRRWHRFHSHRSLGHRVSPSIFRWPAKEVGR